MAVVGGGPHRVARPARRREPHSVEGRDDDGVRREPVRVRSDPARRRPSRRDDLELGAGQADPPRRPLRGPATGQPLGHPTVRHQAPRRLLDRGRVARHPASHPVCRRPPRMRAYGRQVLAAANRLREPPAPRRRQRRGLARLPAAVVEHARRLALALALELEARGRRPSERLGEPREQPLRHH